MQYRFEEFQFLSDIFPTTVNPQNTIIVGSCLSPRRRTENDWHGVSSYILPTILGELSQTYAFSCCGLWCY